MVYKASVGTIQLQQQEDKHFDWRGPVVKKNVKHHKVTKYYKYNQIKCPLVRIIIIIFPNPRILVEET